MPLFRAPRAAAGCRAIYRYRARIRCRAPAVACWEPRCRAVYLVLPLRAAVAARATPHTRLLR